ncbi:9692_t:CDS:1, partial [Racocetra persica]
MEEQPLRKKDTILESSQPTSENQANSPSDKVEIFHVIAEDYFDEKLSKKMRLHG